MDFSDVLQNLRTGLMDNVMLDLETLDTRSSGVIVSIGAVWFDGVDRLGKEFYRVLDLSDQCKYGRTISPDTLKWWFKQSDAARAVMSAPPVKTSQALADFVDFIGEGDKYAKVWGNGADFDNIMLGGLYDTYGVAKPWSYSKNRCFRTLKNLIEMTPPDREGTHHNALDDARYQAVWANLILSKFHGRS